MYIHSHLIKINKTGEKYNKQINIKSIKKKDIRQLKIMDIFAPTYVWIINASAVKTLTYSKVFCKKPLFATLILVIADFMY